MHKKAQKRQILLNLKLLATPKRWLACIDYVQEPILGLLGLVELRDRHRVGGDGFLVQEEEKGLVGVELKAAPHDLH